MEGIDRPRFRDFFFEGDNPMMKYKMEKIWYMYSKS